MADLLLQQNEDEATSVPPLNRGKTIEEVSPRQARRKLANFKSLAAKALWFSESFGLVPDCITLHKAGSGSPLKIPLSAKPPENQQVSSTPLDNERLYQVLFILDRFAVSDEAYHEIRMCSNEASLPPLYTLKQARKELNSSMEIERLQGGYPGAFRPLLNTLAGEIAKVVC